MWTNSTITDAGRAIIARCIDGEQLKFSRAQLGKGTVPAVDLHRQTEITDFADFATISEVKKVDDGIACVVRITPSSQFTFTVKQIGIFGRLSDDSQDSLIAIYQDETGIVIPGDMPEFLYKFSAIMTIDNTDNIEITIESGIYTTRDEVDEIVESERTMLSGTDSIYNPFGAVYDPGDMVIYKNELWQALLTNRFVAPEEGEYWTKVSMKTLSSEITRLSNIKYPSPCNPNLLDNWYFGNPVNQRGLTKANQNTDWPVDRWQLRQASEHTPKYVGYDSTKGCLTIDATNGTEFLYQVLSSKVNRIVGKTVTFSLLTRSGTIYQKTFTFDNIGHMPLASMMTVNVSYAAVIQGLSQMFQLGIAVTGGNSVDILGVKLELGSHQTLAHQENGQWVLNEVPDYGEQLRRCQRYYVQLDPVPIVSINNNQFGLFPVPMAISPSVIANCNGSNFGPMYVNKNGWVGTATLGDGVYPFGKVTAIVPGIGG